MAAGVLVLANVTAESRDLIDAIKQRAAKGPIEVTLLMPGQGPGLNGKDAVRGRLDPPQRQAERSCSGFSSPSCEGWRVTPPPS